MFIQMLLKEKRVAQLLTLLIFIALALVFLAVTYFLQVNEDTMIRSEVKIIEHDMVQAEKAAIANKINRRAADVLFMMDSLRLHEEEYASVTQMWIKFSDRIGIYDQIRYIDRNGDEKIRVNYAPGGSYAVDAAELQNKSDRYYFIDTMTLREGDVFVSKLDLNVENGQIEIPAKPMLRLATPLYGAGGPQGVVVLNYAAEDMLGQLRSIASASVGEICLLNADGYYLYNSGNREKEWAFMYEGREGDSFSSAFPQEWADVAAGAGSGFLNTDNGAFTYTSVTLEKEITGNSAQINVFDSSGSLIIVSYIPADSAVGMLFSQTVFKTLGRVFMKYLSVYFLLTGVAFVLAAFVAVGRAQKKEIRYFSEFDALTGVFNRRVGYGKLNELKKQSADRGYTIAICFIDINGLKEVNDSLGHDMGDELIKTVASVIRDSARGSDFVSRLGGDEFLIVFDRIDATGAEAFWQRIAGRLEKINAEEHRPYRISVSHGIGEFVSNEAASIDEIISRADARMYAEKRNIKKSLTVIRDPRELAET